MHSISLKNVRKHDSRNTRKNVLQKKNKSGYQFAGMLLVACKQHMLLLKGIKSYDSAVVIQHTTCKY